MIADLKAYPANKDSEVEWLRKFPEHWDMQRLRNSVDGCINGIWGDEPNGRDDLVCVRVADFDRQRLRVRLLRPTMRAVATNERRRRMLARGDLLLEKSGGGDQQPVGVVMLYDHDIQAVCSNFVARMPVSAGFDAGYLTYLHCHLYAIRLNVRSIKQTTGIQNLDSYAYLAEPVAFPPLYEQAAIARFLDHADRRIRHHIRAKLMLIKLLDEQKKVIVERALTNGHKGSSENWKPIRLKYVATVQTGITLGKNYGSQQLVEYPYLRVANVQTGSLDLSKITTVRVPEAEARGTTLRTGDVLMTEGGDIDKLGRGCIWRGEVTDCLHQNHVFAVRPRSDALLADYLVVFLASRRGRTYFETTAKKTTNLASTNNTTVGNFPLQLPDIEGQQRILGQISLETSSIEAARGRAAHEIELLREYRTRLIADVVTGKLDVRAAAANLPDDAEEQDELPLADDALASEDDAELTSEELAEKEVVG